MNTRSRILDAALACFVEGGYAQTTIARIRERSGVSNGALFHQFPTKEAIADALYVEAIASFQQGLWELLERPPLSVREAVRGVIAHQIGWIEANTDRARFVYARGNLDWDSPAGAQLDELNRKLADAYRQWMAPFVEAGQIRPLPLLVLNAVVSGPTHAIARQWLAGQASKPLRSYLDQLTDAVAAALSRPPAAATRHRGTGRHARIWLQIVSDDGSAIGQGMATAEILELSAGETTDATAPGGETAAGGPPGRDSGEVST